MREPAATRGMRNERNNLRRRVRYAPMVCANIEALVYPQATR
jgi:hypothetical protein